MIQRGVRSWRPTTPPIKIPSAKTGINRNAKFLFHLWRSSPTQSNHSPATLKAAATAPAALLDQFGRLPLGLNSSPARSRHFWSFAQPRVFLRLCGATLKTLRPRCEAASSTIASPLIASRQEPNRPDEHFNSAMTVRAPLPLHWNKVRRVCCSSAKSSPERTWKGIRLIAVITNLARALFV